MLTYEEILNNCSNYIVKNNKIYEKNTNIEVVDEDKILRIKSSILLFKEARKDYEEIIKMFGKTDKPKDYFLKNGAFDFDETKVVIELDNLSISGFDLYKILKDENNK